MRSVMVEERRLHDRNFYPEDEPGSVRILLPSKEEVRKAHSERRPR